MKIIPKTKKDFAWVKYSPDEIRTRAKKSVEILKKVIDEIKNIPKEKRNFENTVYALEATGETASIDNPMFFLHYVSTDPAVRKASEEMEEYISKEAININTDKDLYRAFLEYNPKSEKLSNVEIRLYEDYKRDFERKGFHLPEKIQDKIKRIKKEISTLHIKFSSNIASHHDFILCTKEELLGLPDSYISNLKIDSKTKKYIVTLAYPEMGPFMEFADNHKKRQELADKISQKGGKENIKILGRLLRLRRELANLLGFKYFADYEVEKNIANSSKIIETFLKDTIKKLEIGYRKEFSELEKYVKNKFGNIKLTYFNTGYYSAKMKKDLFDYDPNHIKEYFELNAVIEKMFEIFGGLFNVTFKENKVLPKWHKDMKIFDVLDKGKVCGHIGFDLYPRKDKYSHMACWNLIRGRANKFRGDTYLAPTSVIVGNFPNGTKATPSLLSFGEIETMFHEFGHAMHGVLSRATFASQSGTSVMFDFVEMPSQLFENWVDNAKNIKNISMHYKTGKKLDDKMVDKILQSKKFREQSEFYRIFVMSLQDLEMHTNKWNINPIVLDRQIRKKYFSIHPSPKSLFPASWGHMTDYAAKYYAYMWAIVYSYDVFSRFKKEGIMNKKVGMELRRKILEKGDSEDPIKLMTDFLGRKPNNKAFLEALK